MHKCKRKSVKVTEIDGPDAREILERFRAEKRELDKTLMQLEIAHPEQIKTAKAMPFPLVATTVCGDGRNLWLVAVRKSLGGKNEDKVYRVHRPRGIKTEEMLHALESVTEHLTGLPKGIKVEDADIFDF